MVELSKTVYTMVVFVGIIELMILFQMPKRKGVVIDTSGIQQSQYEFDRAIKLDDSPARANVKTASGESLKDGASLCVAILTGAPPGERKKSAARLLRNLIEFAEIPTRNIHVFYDNVDPKDLTYDPKRLGLLLHPASMLNSTSNDIPVINAHKIVRPGNAKLKKHMMITQNYQFMLDRLFKDLKYRYCAILEDDLILSKDTGDYLEAGVKLMDKDPKVMSVSLFNDNSFSWCSSNETFFRRVGHFGGLGFLMSGKHYVGILSSKLNIKVPWDATFQRELANNKMVTIIPELSRSLHMENQAINIPSDLRIPSDDTEAISIYDGPRVKHSLDNLGEKEYDEFITQFVRSAHKIDYLEDAAFFFPSQDKQVPNFVFTNCNNQKEASAVMASHGLVGLGNGGVVRGDYKDTVFLRPYGNLVLMVCKPSMWYGVANNAPSATDLIHTFVNKITWKLLDQTMGRPKMGILYHLENFDYEIRKGKSGQSCFDVCAANNEICDKVGISILDTNCGILKVLAPEYNSCKEAPVSVYKSKEFFLPAMDPAGTWLISKRIPNFYFYNCYAAKTGFSRICSCK
ncbi:unnamed protein product [Owenia fusiformis]|uniref:Alpha-1,3-mannosyl-glycoprotein 2-beta-N-acetylglucosaminyltransferase n=1 Tax=Owenia fusiformis TaxID=6347 RepID=A0A8J1THN0_OWEFU|nr:unnamed protein product [Owenia fusiformis]